MIETTPVERVGLVEPDTFLRQYKAVAQPVILEELTREWPARERWTPDYFREVAGDAVVPLYDSRPARDNEHQHAASLHMPLAEYLDLLEGGERDLRLFFFNLFAARPTLARDFEFPDIGLRLFRKLPVLFMGGKDARVQMHFDIDRPDILLCHFGGPKRVLLVAPEYTPYMYHVPFSFSALASVDFEDPDYQRHPALRHVRGHLAELHHGDVLYIPPGFWHYVLYDDIGFSMALRAFPRDLPNVARMLSNLLVTRTIEGTMRKLVGQAWNDRNERRAVERTAHFLARHPGKH
ncbi:cupin-like domain-containing protein [Thioalkalivibrio sp. ALM2T]|uniref:cupin-like domain-containing protein n=1 Tax=Thioalkalivibrio sp. ALM2T TaxID=1158184 RepID=UPI00036262A8|nr:cupin-like domain-containing protein [Thioalkalivibrio sp. ALM2T]